MRQWRSTRWTLTLLVVASTASAQQPVASAKPPPGYAGGGACVDCHKSEVAEFSATDLGTSGAITGSQDVTVTLN